MDLMGGVQEAMRRVLVARGVRSRVTDVDGQPVHFYALPGQGKGPPAVLVHGLGGSAGGFSRVFFELARRFSRVLAVDLPGHGFSSEYGKGPVSVRAQFDVLRDWVRQEVGEPAYVVGNSLGGAMSIELAAEHPDWVRALALVAPAGAQLAPERMEELLASFEVESTAQSRALTRKLFHKPPLAALMFAGALRQLYTTATVRALAADVRATRAFLAPDVLQGLKMPVLLLWGESDGLLPHESLDYFRQHLPRGSDIQLVRGFGHVPQMERPDELVARLVDFAGARGL
ncbi:alpha/beta fold hydrolase [Myxococcaceae bacterium GXIMD 01537]